MLSKNCVYAMEKFPGIDIYVDKQKKTKNSVDKANVYKHIKPMC